VDQSVLEQMSQSLDAKLVLWLFISLRLGQLAIERLLATLNRRYYSATDRQSYASRLLGISSDEMRKSVAYSNDKYIYARVAGTLSLAGSLAFLSLGGLGWAEGVAQRWSKFTFDNEVITGLYFFGLLGLVSGLFGLPFDYYRTFVLEQRHGFNRQTPKGFWLDRLKGVVVAMILGAPLLSLLLWLIQAAGSWWWVYAWAAVSLFSVLTAWLYPTLLAVVLRILRKKWDFAPLEFQLWTPLRGPAMAMPISPVYSARSASCSLTP
jgi:STE24 endopeptidase